MIYTSTLYIHDRKEDKTEANGKGQSPSVGEKILNLHYGPDDNVR